MNSSPKRNGRERPAAGSVTLADMHHASSLLAALTTLQRDAAYCDVLLQAQVGSAAGQAAGRAAGARGVWAHSIVLAAASPYFYAMFSDRFNDIAVHVVDIKDVKLETLRALVTNIYSPSSLPDTVESGKAVLAAATALAVADVRDAVCGFLANELAADNALSVRAFAEQHDCAALAAAATRFILRHGERVLQGVELLALTPGQLTELLASNQLAAREQCVLDAVLRWTQHRPQERHQHLQSLLQTVRLTLVPRQVLAERVRAVPLADAVPGALQLIIEALLFDSPAQRPRRPPGTQPVALLVLGGVLGGVDSVLACSLPGGGWQPAAALPEKRSLAAAAELDGRVYVIGGHNDRGPTRAVLVYESATGGWSAGPPTAATTARAAAAALAGRVYAVGGWRHMAEALDPREGVWRPVAPLSMRRGGLGLAAHAGRLYAVGGRDEKTALDCTERYDPAADAWETVEPMAQRRYGVGLAAVEGALYAVGGWEAPGSEHRSVERYREGAGWEPARDMAAPRSHAAAAAHGGRLYVVGGSRGGDVLTGVTMFDPQTGAWTELAALPAGRSAAAAVLVAWPPGAV